MTKNDPISNFCKDLLALEGEIRVKRQNLETYERNITSRQSIGRLSKESKNLHLKIESIVQQLDDLFHKANLLSNTQTSDPVILSAITTNLYELKNALDQSKKIR